MENEKGTLCHDGENMLQISNIYKNFRLQPSKYHSQAERGSMPVIAQSKTWVCTARLLELWVRILLRA